MRREFRKSSNLRNWRLSSFIQRRPPGRGEIGAYACGRPPTKRPVIPRWTRGSPVRQPNTMYLPYRLISIICALQPRRPYDRVRSRSTRKHLNTPTQSASNQRSNRSGNRIHLRTTSGTVVAVCQSGSAFAVNHRLAARVTHRPRQTSHHHEGALILQALALGVRSVKIARLMTIPPLPEPGQSNRHWHGRQSGGVIGNWRYFVEDDTRISGLPHRRNLRGSPRERRLHGHQGIQGARPARWMHHARTFPPSKVRGV